MSSSFRKKSVKRKKNLVLISFAIIAAMGGCCFLWSQMPDQPTVTAVSVNRNNVSKTDNTIIEYNGTEYHYNDHLTNYLFLGIDTREKVSDYTRQSDAGQADVIFLISVDRVTKKTQILVIPRDTITEIEVFNPSGKSLGTTQDHINIQYAYGDGKDKSCQLMSDAVSRLLGNIPIQKYCSLNMDGIPLLTEAVDGVTVTVPDSSLEFQNPEFYEGAVVELTSGNTEMFVRYRDTLQPGSAMIRQTRQKVFMKAFIEKARKKATENASFVIDLFEGLKPYTITNISNDVFAELLTASEGTMADIKTVPGETVEGENFDEYHVYEEELTRLLVEMLFTK